MKYIKKYQHTVIEFIIYGLLFIAAVFAASLLSGCAGANELAASTQKIDAPIAYYHDKIANWGGEIVTHDNNYIVAHCLSGIVYYRFNYDINHSQLIPAINSMGLPIECQDFQPANQPNTLEF